MFADRFHKKAFARQIFSFLILFVSFIMLSGSSAENVKYYDYSSPYWYSESADKGFSYKAYTDQDNLLVAVNYEGYPVALWNDDPFIYQADRTYRLEGLIMAINGQVHAGPDHHGKGGLLFKANYDNGAFKADNQWHHIVQVFTAKNSAIARPYIRFSDGLGGKVHHLYIQEIASIDDAGGLERKEIEGLLSIDPGLMALPTLPPVSLITLDPDYFHVPGRTVPGIQPTPTPGPRR